MSSSSALLAAAAVALGATGAASAQAVVQGLAHAAATTALPATPAQLVIQGQALHRGEFDALRGEYALADGRVLSIAKRGRHLVAEIDGRAAQRLQAVAPSVYRSAGGDLQISFAAAANGSVSAVRLAQRAAP